MYDKIINKILATRGISSPQDIEKFLNPSLADLLDPYKLNGMIDAVNRINLAIDEKQIVLIYGDYDADGICSVSMLYLFLKSKGLNPIAFIPNRHTDGYGLSVETIEMLAEKFLPDLIITVDTGISACAEIDFLNDIGIDVIVTDHHEPSSVVPNCIIVDPKMPNQQDYGFYGLSGAGVVFKLITAMAGLDEAMEYIDICAISTIGDIVPLLNENRIITYYGLEKINSNKCRKSIKFFMEKLGVRYLSSTDIAFKVVPKLNASGRMDSSDKCFAFLISDDNAELDCLYEQIEADNNERLKQTSLIFEKFAQYFDNYDINKEPALFVRDDSINLGIIGIVASKLCNQYCRPAFVVTKDDSGNIKGSVRSPEGINIFDLLDKHRNKLVDIGGHSLAGGFTVTEENYANFKDAIMADMRNLYASNSIIEKIDCSFEICENDLSLSFVSALKKLEPFGHQNEKPTFLLRVENANYVQTKSFRHYKICTPSKKEILSFFGYKYLPYFYSNHAVNVFLQLDADEFRGIKQVKAIAKKIECDNMDIKPNIEYQNINDLLCYYLSLDSISKKSECSFSQYDSDIELQSLLDKQFGTVFFARDPFTAKEFAEKNKLNVGISPNPQGKNCVIFNPYQIINKNQIVLYKNIVCLNGCYKENIYQYLGKNVLSLKKELGFGLNNITRERFAEFYKFLKNSLNFECNDFIELCIHVSKILKDFSLFEIALCLLIAAELQFAKFVVSDTISFEFVQNPIKRELADSLLFSIK